MASRPETSQRVRLAAYCLLTVAVDVVKFDLWTEMIEQLCQGRSDLIFENGVRDSSYLMTSMLTPRLSSLNIYFYIQYRVDLVT